jgi:hypothetical protein
MEDSREAGDIKGGVPQGGGNLEQDGEGRTVEQRWQEQGVF